MIAIVFSVSGGGSLISSCLISQLQQVNPGLHLDTHHLDTDDQKGPVPSNSLDSLIPRRQGSSAVLMRMENDYFQLSSEASDLPLDKRSIPFFFMVSQTLGDISVSETIEVSENVVTYPKSQCIMEHKMTYTAQLACHSCHGPPPLISFEIRGGPTCSTPTHRLRGISCFCLPFLL